MGIQEIIDEELNNIEDEVLGEDVLGDALIEEEEKKDEDFYNEGADETDNLDDLNLSKYLQENFSFAEIDQMSLEQYISEELNKPSVKVLKELLETEKHPKGFPTFEELMTMKKEHNSVFIIRVGLDYEQDVFGIPTEIYVCRTLKSKDHKDMLKELPQGEDENDFMGKFMISRSVLYPELRLEDIDKLKVGVVDVLLPAIMKHSRFNPNHQVFRI